MAQPVSASALGKRALSLNCGVAALADEMIAIPRHRPASTRIPTAPLWVCVAAQPFKRSPTHCQHA